MTKNSGDNTTPSISPDERKIAFASTREDGKYQIYVMNMDGSNVKKLTSDPKLAFINPMWSKDGKKIVYYSDKGDRKDQIWVMNADGSNQTLLTQGKEHNIFPSWSSDGKMILFSSSNREGGNEGYVNGSYLYLMNSDGSNLNVHSPTLKAFSPDSRPTVKKIAFISGKPSATGIFIADADGSDRMRIIPPINY